MKTLRLWDNPLIIRGVRSRLRLPHLLSWGVVTIVISVFIYRFVSGNATRFGVSEAVGAREAILPLLIMQGVILMVMGTGAVAGGMARERTYRLLDYLRLTPMSPGAKIVGMLFGLPIREYFMFALTLPFVFYAAWVGGLSFGVLLKFYVVFFCSTLVYHMTGLAAGMVVDKPWRAGTVSQGLVIVLYFLLPITSRFGFTFFEYLTARPVFFGLVEQHLFQGAPHAFMRGPSQHTNYDSVAFFNLTLSPTLFSIAVQAYALLSLYLIVYRKWVSETRLAFSKRYAVVFFALAQLFLVGSVQPLLQNDAFFRQLAESYGRADPVNNPARAIVFIILLINLVVSGCVAILTVFLCTPNWHQSVMGLRRARKRGAERLPLSEDAASALPVAFACALTSWLGFIAVYQSALSAGRIAADNPIIEVALPLLLFLAVLLVVQQVVEQFTERIFIMVLFVFWIVPVMTMLIVATVMHREVLGMYIALFFPGVGLWMACTMLVTDSGASPDTDLLPSVFVRHAMPIVMLSLLVYGGAACALLLRARRRWVRIARAAQSGPATKDEPPRVAPDAIDDAAAPAYATVSDAPTGP